MARESAVRDRRFWALLGLFVLLLGLQLALPRLDADQAVTGLMGVHVLRGELPVFFWRQDHAGVPESYGAAVTFFLLGVSRLTLGLVPALAALGYVLLLYRTAALLFGPGAGRLALLYATVVSPYVASHYVLARAYYVEHLLVGQVVLLGAALWLARGPALSLPARERSLVAMGLAGGLGLYFGFQIVVALLPAALALLLVDPRLPRRRGAWLGAGAFLAGSLPFWAYNLAHDWATFATGARFRGEQAAGEAARILFRDLVPVVLGVQDFVGTPAYLPGPLALVAPALAAAAALGLTARVLLGLRRLRADPARAGEALVVVALGAVLGVVWAGRFLQVPRYLVPLAPPLALLLARATQLLWARTRAGTVALVAAYLAAVGLPLLASLPVLWPTARAEYRTARADDQALFDFLGARGLTRAYGFEYWLAPRLTFDAAERVIVAEPFNDRHPPYTEAVDGSPRPAYVLRGEVDRVAGWLRAGDIRYARAEVGPYTVFWDFVAPPSLAPVTRSGWTATAGPGRGAPERVLDGQLRTGWASSPGPSGSAWLEVTTGRPVRLAGLALLTDRPEHGPQVLEATIDDARTGQAVTGTLDTGGLGITWRNGAPRVGPGRTLTVRFPPVETRRVRLTERAPGGSWAVAELFPLGPADPGPGPPGDGGLAAALDAPRRLETAGDVAGALRGYREAMRRFPDAPDAYAAFARLADAAGLRARSRVAEAEALARVGLLDEARATYAGVAAALGPGMTHAELSRRRAELAAAAGDAREADGLAADAARVLAPSRPLEVVFGRRVALDGFGLGAERVRPGETLPVSYYWRLLGPAPRPLTVTVHFRGAARFGDDHDLPGWLPDLGGGAQRLRDDRLVTVPPGTPPGRYRLVVGVWDAEARTPLRRFWRGLVPTLDRTVELGAIEVRPP